MPYTDLETLVQSVMHAPEGSHFILVSKDKKPTHKWGASASKPSKQEVVEHLRNGGYIGLIPASFGWGFVDYDLDTPDELEQIAREVKPVAILPTAKPHHCHMVCHLTQAELVKYWGNARMSCGDWRCGNGYAVLHPGCERPLQLALSTTWGMPRAGDGGKHNFQHLFKKVPPKKKALKKNTDDQQKSPDKAPKKGVVTPGDLDEAEAPCGLSGRMAPTSSLMSLKTSYLSTEILPRITTYPTLGMS